MKLFKVFCICSVLCLGCALPVANTPDLSHLTPEDRALVYVEYGLAEFSNSHYFEAEGQLRRALAFAPKAKNVRYNLALTLIKSQQYQEAFTLLSNLIEEQGTHLYRSTLADLYLKQFNYDQALKIYLELLGEGEAEQNRKIIARNARNVAQVLFTLGEEEEALCFSERAVQAGGVDEDTEHAALLMAFGQAQEIVKNREALEAARQRRDSDLIIWYALANYDLAKYQDAHFLVKILEAESLSGGFSYGLKEFIGLVNAKYKYAQVTDLEPDRMKLNQLIRNYWPISVLEDLS